MKKIASNVKIGDTIKSPFSPSFGIVNKITSTDKKITFHITYTKNKSKELIGTKWSYTFFKTTKINVI